MKKGDDFVTRRESCLIFSNLFFTIFLIGASFNFIAVQNNGGKMPFLINNFLDLGYEDVKHTYAQSCSDVNYCFFIDRYDLYFLDKIIIYSIGDVVIIVGALGILICNATWAILFMKTKFNRRRK